jgi:hypothetical protein
MVGNVFIYQIENEYGDQWNNVAEKIPNPPAIVIWNCWRVVPEMQVSMSP